MIKLYRGDCLKILRRLPDCSVQCCVTSPPYWGLRDYGVAGQLGLEPTPEAYVARMVEVFREVRRVLRDDGTLWLNMGDSYASNGVGGGSPVDVRKYGDRPTRENDKVRGRKEDRSLRIPPGLKAKDLVGMPWRLAFALQADGWYLRSDIIWHKPNPMPESVRDRPTKAHEYVFLMSKSERYFWDQEAVREDAAVAPHAAGYVNGKDYATGPMNRNGHSQREGDQSRIWAASGGRNIRSVWTITPKPFKGAHFATFPPELVDRCVKAGTSERGACPQCGKPWERVTKRKFYGAATDHKLTLECGKGRSWRHPRNIEGYEPAQTLGFRPACTCQAAAEPVPCVVLDPFVGSGTTAAVARSLGRDCIGIDLNPKYLTMARARVKAEQLKVALHVG